MNASGSTLEATHHGKTRSRGLGSSAARGDRRGGSDRVFRDIHGTESTVNSHTVRLADDAGFRTAIDGFWMANSKRSLQFA